MQFWGMLHALTGVVSSRIRFLLNRRVAAHDLDVNLPSLNCIASDGTAMDTVYIMIRNVELDRSSRCCTYQLCMSCKSCCVW